MDAQAFLGMSKKRGQDFAEANNMIFHLIRIDEESFFSYPEDKREDRICIEIDGGKISKAVIQ